jgi:HJR/Mrr/RecB family endonuclease
MVQVKKHIGNTGDWAVQQIIMFNQNNQYKQYNNDDESCVMYNTILWIISSGDDFSTAAKEMARENNVRLINGKEFAKLLLENGIEHLPL